MLYEVITGIRFRGKTIPETFACLPKAPGSDYPTVEAFWYFLLTGEVPTPKQVEQVLAEWKIRQHVPGYVFDAIRALPLESHPMTMLSVGIMAMQKDSKFARFYESAQFNKMVAWETVYEDACDVITSYSIHYTKLYETPVSTVPKNLSF